MPQFTYTKDVRQRLKLIRGFVDFNYKLADKNGRKLKLTKTASARINRAYNDILALNNRPTQVFRARTKKNLKLAQEFGHTKTKNKDIKVAFIPNDGKTKVKMRFNKSGVTATIGKVRQHSIKLNKRALALDPIGYTQRVVDKNKFPQYAIQAGDYEIPNAFLASEVASAVAQLVEKYGDDEGDPEDYNHHWKNWLQGLNGYDFGDQADLDEYLTGKHERIISDKKERRNASEKRRYAARRRDEGKTYTAKAPKK